MKKIKNIEFFIFDLDNTLYSGQTKVFERIDKRMSKYISKKLNIDLTKRPGELSNETYYKIASEYERLFN